MKTLYTIEVKCEKNSNNTMPICEQGGHLAVYEFKQVAKNKFKEIYAEQRERLLKLGVKPYPKNRFVIKEYIEKVEE